MGKLIVDLVPLVLILGGVFWAGYASGRRSERTTDQADRKELSGLRTMREQLMTKAAEHSVLGDDFAVIALGILERKGKP